MMHRALGATARLSRTASAVAAAAGCGILAACASGGLTTAALQLPSIDIMGPADKVVGTPIEVYTRVARGALSCWFGASGPLKGGFVYHADAEPRGGRSEIVIHEREIAGSSPRALKAFRVQIAAEGEEVLVASENLKLPDALGTSMKADVKRWSVGGIGCSETPSLPAGWAPQDPNAQPAQPVKPAPKGKVRRA